MIKISVVLAALIPEFKRWFDTILKVEELYEEDDMDFDNCGGANSSWLRVV